MPSRSIWVAKKKRGEGRISFFLRAESFYLFQVIISFPGDSESKQMTNMLAKEFVSNEFQISPSAGKLR